MVELPLMVMPPSDRTAQVGISRSMLPENEISVSEVMPSESPASASMHTCGLLPDTGGEVDTSSAVPVPVTVTAASELNGLATVTGTVLRTVTFSVMSDALFTPCPCMTCAVILSEVNVSDAGSQLGLALPDAPLICARFAAAVAAVCALLVCL